MDDERDDPQDLHELSEAARRGMQRAGIHLMKAAIEVVAGLSAFLEEINAGRSDTSDDDDDERGPQRIAVE